MDECDLPEHAAFSWIQRTAMHERVRMDDIARRVINDGLRPAPS
jgi:AmiR/NasT family two-component response regulator